MTPNNIVNMSLLKGLECIAVCDHNSVAQQQTMALVAKERGLHYIYGIEVQTIEEVHVLALFEKVCGKAPDFSAQSAEKLAVSALAVRALFENAPFRFRTPEDSLAAAKALAGAPEEKNRAVEDLFGALESFG